MNYSAIGAIVFGAIGVHHFLRFDRGTHTTPQEVTEIVWGTGWVAFFGALIGFVAGLV